MEYKDLQQLHQHDDQLQEEYAHFHYYKPSFTCSEPWSSTNFCSFGESSEINQRSCGDGSSISEHCHHHPGTGEEIWPAAENKTTSYNTALSSSSSSSSSSDLSALEIMSPSLLLSCSLGLTCQILLGGSDHHGLHLSRHSFGLHQGMQHQQQNTPSNTSSSNKISGGSGVGRAKTSRAWSQKKEYEARGKKSRTTTSCPTLKVTKEKLGDRIQTLQRLVAPFGKTNTASVLNETIGYIHFLHHQIQTLSIPYMKSQKTNPFETVLLSQRSKEENKRESKAELESKGLCLVPLSCVSYLYNLD